MKKRKSKNSERHKLHQATCLEDLFLYALYGFRGMWEVCKVKDNVAKRVKYHCGENIKGFSLCIPSSSLIHFLDSHFSEHHQDQRGVRFADINKIGRVVNSVTAIKSGNRDNTIVFESNFPNKELFRLVVKVDYENKLLLGLSFLIKT